MQHKIIVLDVSSHNASLAATLAGLERMVAEAANRAVRFTIVTFGADSKSPRIEYAATPAHSVNIKSLQLGGAAQNMYDAIERAYMIANDYLTRTAEDVTGVEMAVLSSLCNRGSDQTEADISRIFHNCINTGWVINMRGLDFPKMQCIGHKLGLPESQTINLKGNQLHKLIDASLRDTVLNAEILKTVKVGVK